MTEPAREDAPLLRFGVVADPQYADLPGNPATGRYYAESLAKLTAAIDHFNREDLAFVVTLGDLIDRDWENFDAVLPLYERLRHKNHILLGNHDFSVAAERLAEVFARVGMPAPYYSFAVGTYRFIALDGNDVSTFAPPVGDPRRALAAERLAALQQAGADNAQSWNASLSDTQFAWLQQRLAAAKLAGEQVVVLGHYPIWPPGSHTMWDAERIAALLSGQDHVLAYLSGHDHRGNLGHRGRTAFVNFRGMVDTPDDNAYAIVEIHADRLQIFGFGREPSRTLPF